jgi:ABC-2 type transport system permease protein
MTAITLDRPGGAVRDLAPGPTLGRLVTVELRKMLDTRAGFWLLVLTALISVGAVAIRLISEPTGGLTFARFFDDTVLATGVLLPVLGTLAVTSEWSQRTALATFSLVPRRERVIGAKLLAGVALGLISVVVCLLVAAAANALAPVLGDASAGWTLPLAHVGRATLYAVLGMLGGLAFGLVLMTTAPAIVLSFLMPLLFTGLAGIQGLAGTLPWLDVWAAGSELVSGAMTGDAWAHLATGSALWIVLPLGIGFIRLRRREIA